MKITYEFLKSITRNGSFVLTERQKALLSNYNTDYSKGWIKRIVGKNIPNVLAERLKAVMNIRDVNSTYIREVLDNRLFILRQSGKEYTYPMKDFRHALFRLTRECKSIKDIDFHFNVEEQIMVAVLLFHSCKIQCSYNHRAEICDQIHITQYAMNDGCELLVRASSTSCEDLIAVIKSCLPKSKVVVKVKK